MPEQIPERADIRQLRTQAKELLRTLSGEHKLADAQLLLARKYGFESWPKLVDAIETPVLISKFKTALESGDSVALEKLLRGHASLRKRMNEPMFSFDSQPILFASKHAEAQKLLPILVRYGADPNVRSKWWAGGFSALDHATDKAIPLLLELGAKFDVWSAAAHGRIDELKKLLDSDPSSVNAPGGDGQRPLHLAATPEIAEMLIERGADLEQKDVDHEGTPIQHHVNNPEILRVLLRHGAKPDIFTAVALDDVDLLRRILKEDPTVAESRVGKPPFATAKSNGGHIYTYNIGPGKTPLHFAAERGSKAVLEELQKKSSPSRRLVAAAWMEDAEAVGLILREHPNMEMGGEVNSIAIAAQAGKTETVRLLLEAGLDPKAPGLDSGTALHVAAWFGYIEIVKLLVGQVPLEMRDATHGSTPLGWAAHGAHWCGNKEGDYVGVVETLLKAGADATVPANSSGNSMLTQAGNREDVKDFLRRYGAS